MSEKHAKSGEAQERNVPSLGRERCSSDLRAIQNAFCFENLFRMLYIVAELRILQASIGEQRRPVALARCAFFGVAKLFDEYNTKIRLSFQSLYIPCRSYLNQSINHLKTATSTSISFFPASRHASPLPPRISIPPLLCNCRTLRLQ